MKQKKKVNEAFITKLIKKLEKISSLKYLEGAKFQLIRSEATHTVMVDDLPKNYSQGLIGAGIMTDKSFGFSLLESEPKKRISPVFSINSSTAVCTRKNAPKKTCVPWVIAICKKGEQSRLLRFENKEIMHLYARLFRLLVKKLKELGI